MNNIEIFKTGTQTATNGDTLVVDNAYMNDVVASYNKQHHEAPAVIGHPKDNHPAYGWVESLSFDEGSGVLFANFTQVEPQFEQMLKDGRFKKRSASFYPANHPSNPVKGKPYLRHVGFLGAQPPAVKGLKDFSDDVDCPTYEFTEFNNQSTNSKEEHTMSDKDTQTTLDDDEKAKVLAEREAKLKEEEAKLKQREEEIAKKEKEFADKQAAEQKKGFADFSESLIAAGKITPAEKDAVVTAFISIDNTDSTFDFAENGTVSKKTGVEVLQSILQRGANVIDFSEHTGSDPNTAGKPSFGDSDAAADDALHKEIQDFAEKNNISFAEAAIQFNGA